MELVGISRSKQFSPNHTGNDTQIFHLTIEKLIAKGCKIREYSEEEFLQLAEQIQRLYDDELVANQTKEQYIQGLTWDVNNMKEKEVVISSYSLSSSTDVDYFEADGYSWAKLYLTFTLRQGTGLEISEEVFLLREDTEGHWKIYGFKLAEDVTSDGE